MRFVLALVLVLWAATVYAQPVVDDKRTATGISVTSISNGAHVSSSQANRAMFIGVLCNQSSGITLSSITVDGAAATSIWDTELNTGTARIRTIGYYYLNATTGTNKIVATFSGTCLYATLHVVSLYNVEPTGPIGTATTPAGNSTGTSATATVSSPASNDLILDFLAINTATPTIGADQIQQTSTSFSGNGARVSTQLGSLGGVMSWTWTGNNPWAIAAVPFKAATTPPPAARRRILNSQ